MATGFAAMQQAVKNISGGGGRGGRGFSYFNLKEDGDEIIIRFLTDAEEILTCDFYEYVKTRVKNKEGKWVDGANSFIVAPDFYADRDDAPAGLQDWVAKYGGKTVDYNTKELVDPKPKERTVAIAVERERVAVPQEAGAKGRPKFKHQDKIVEITYKDKDGNEKTASGRNFILIRKDAKTFWGNVTGYFGEFGTFLDRDYKITRTGTGLGTNYPCIPVGTEEDWEDKDTLVATVHGRYGYGGKDADGKDVDTEGEDRFYFCPSTLDEWAIDQAKEDRVKSALSGGDDTTSSNGSSTPKSAPADEAQASSAPDRGDVADLRARLEAHN